jgi:hypothetical protein
MRPKASFAPCPLLSSRPLGAIGLPQASFCILAHSLSNHRGPTVKTAGARSGTTGIAFLQIRPDFPIVYRLHQCCSPCSTLHFKGQRAICILVSISAIMSQLYSPSLFLNASSESSLAPSSLESSITTSSMYTTTTSHTVPGIGSLTGKFIHGFGKTVLRGVEGVFIRRRLSYIQSLCPFLDNNPPPDVGNICDDLLELARCVSIVSFVMKMISGHCT